MLVLIGRSNALVDLLSDDRLHLSITQLPARDVRRACVGRRSSGVLLLASLVGDCSQSMARILDRCDRGPESSDRDSIAAL